jgi:ribosome-binding factor A
MSSARRIEKINILIKEELARIIDREIELPAGIFLTITRVGTSQDLHYSNVFVSVLGDIKEKDILDILEKNVYSIQQMLNRKLRMRPVPRIKFLIDEEELRREKIEKSLAELKLKGEL